MPAWSFVTNHSLILAAIAKYPHRTTRNIGDAIGITERSTHKIINDLEAAGYITKVKTGRRNEYVIHPDVPLKDKVKSEATARELLLMLGWKPKKSRIKNRTEDK